MREVSRILFPVDLTEDGSRMVPYVLTFAKAFKAEIHLLFVVQPLDQYATFYVPHPTVDSMEADIVAGAERKMDEFIMEHFDDYPLVKRTVKIGDIGDEINEFAVKHDMDLVIIGTHGKKGLERVIFGSVADRVVRGSRVPVLSLNPHYVM